MKIYFQAESFSKNKYKLKPPTYINTFSFQMYELACGEASATSMEKEKKNSGKSGKQKAQEDDSICHLSYSS